MPLQKTKISKQEPTRLPAPQICCFTKFLAAVGSIALSSSLPHCNPLQSFGTAQPPLMTHMLRRWRRRAHAFAPPFEEPSKDPSMAFSVRAKCNTRKLKSRSELAIEISFGLCTSANCSVSLLEPLAAPTVGGDVVSCGHVSQETRGSSHGGQDRGKPVSPSVVHRAAHAHI